MHSVYVNNGYIISIVRDGNGSVTDAEYQKIEAALRARPTAPEGYDYRLTMDLAWELYKLPEPIPEEPGDMATEEDYQAALADLGVDV